MTADLIREARRISDEWDAWVARPPQRKYAPTEPCGGAVSRLLRSLVDALEQAEKERDGAAETIRRVWNILGNPSMAWLAGRSIYDLVALGVSAQLDRDRLRAENEKLREELMRCGSLAVSNRIDGSLGKRAALHIREIAHRTCWPDDDEAELRREAEMPC